MAISTVDPNAGPFAPRLVDALVAAASREGSGPLVEAAWNHEHSNDLCELRFRGGRTLVAKRARHAWAADAFEAAAAAAPMLNRSGVVAPSPIPLPGNVDDMAVQAYWRIELPTLAELWPGLGPDERARAMESWGRLARRLHRIRLPGWGTLPRAAREAGPPLASVLETDLAGRLLPAAAAVWPRAVPSLEALIARVPAVARRAARAGRSSLVHNDLHMRNVLCRVGDDGGVRCVGLLDLEAVAAAPPESDLAGFDVLHGPLFSQPLEARWKERFRTGYGAPPDRRALSFYRAVHLANMGFHAALTGMAEHAAAVARALRTEVESLVRAGGRRRSLAAAG